MSTKDTGQAATPAAPAEAVADGPFDDAAVARYLLDHPDFLLRHEEVVRALQLERREGRVVSLTQHQLEALRRHGTRLEQRLESLLQNARDNDRRFDIFRRLLPTLLATDDLYRAFDILDRTIGEDFGIAQRRLLLQRPLALPDLPRLLAPPGSHDAIPDHVKNGSGHMLGPLRPAQLKALFDSKFTTPWSAALIPVRHDDASLAILALASEDTDRFAPDQERLFLDLLADIAAALLVRCL